MKFHSDSMVHPLPASSNVTDRVQHIRQENGS